MLLTFKQNAHALTWAIVQAFSDPFLCRMDFYS